MVTVLFNRQAGFLGLDLSLCPETGSSPLLRYEKSQQGRQGNLCHAELGLAIVSSHDVSTSGKKKKKTLCVFFHLHLSLNQISWGERLSLESQRRC